VPGGHLTTVALTVVAMLAFAGNSILCRMALGQDLIDASSFTTIRAASGAIVLVAIVLVRRHPFRPGRSSWLPATVLFAYMIAFSFAYLSLSAGTGALILFGAVQVTMILWAIQSGERLTGLSWLGLGLALIGLGWLVSPGVTAPDLRGALLMAASGIAWGVYSLLGRQADDPALSTARNFVLATPMAIVVSLLQLGGSDWTGTGIALAAASGGITSGLGYVVWYAAVRRLTATQAASVQLTVPVIAAVVGVVVLSELVTARLLLSSAAVLGGVGIVVRQRAVRGGRTGSR
jgi:drug/metabolite transporter (DMT)-like permease